MRSRKTQCRRNTLHAENVEGLRDALTALWRLDMVSAMFSSVAHIYHHVRMMGDFAMREETMQAVGSTSLSAMLI